eukprot:2801425-Pleurochrysis_carterae.AAC.1
MGGRNSWRALCPATYRCYRRSACSNALTPGVRGPGRGALRTPVREGAHLTGCGRAVSDPRRGAIQGRSDGRRRRGRRGTLQAACACAC